MKRLFALSVTVLLAACGQKAELKPVTGQTLPPAAYGADVRPDTDKLLELDPLAAPVRSVELRKRSEVREDDPFDLPPE